MWFSNTCFRLSHGTEKERVFLLSKISPDLEIIIVLASFSIVWYHAVLNSLRLVISSVDKNSVKRIIVGISLSAYFLELLRILHNFLSQFINCDQHLELVDICGSKEEIPVNSYEIPNLPTKNKQTNKYIPVLQVFEFLKNIHMWHQMQSIYPNYWSLQFKVYHSIQRR